MSILSIAATKSAHALLSLLKHGGSLPGSIGLKLDPGSLQKLQIDCPVILITGTNGKTSTSNLIASAFEKAGYRVVNNAKGDNMLAGITTTLLSAASLSGKVKADVIILEVDELNVRHVLPKLPVSSFLVTNFFRDQLDRAFEMDQLIQTIENVLPEYQGDLILNGNDPNSLRLLYAAPKANIIFTGLEVSKESERNSSMQEASEGKFCPRCHHALEYDSHHYSHLGYFHCPNCEFKTPKLDVLLEKIDVKERSYNYQGQRYHAPYEGLYSMFNYASLHAIASLYHLGKESIEQVYAHAPKPKGRNETFTLKESGQEKQIILNLVKNPTGANEVLKVIEADEKDKQVVIVLNDHEQDGTDVSWIYDTGFEHMLGSSTKKVITTGSRGYDMALRLYYEGYQSIEVQEDLEEAVRKGLDGTDNLYVIATYTALLPARNAILKVMK